MTRTDTTNLVNKPQLKTVLLKAVKIWFPFLMQLYITQTDDKDNHHQKSNKISKAKKNQTSK
jgi:hypothetical protein